MTKHAAAAALLLSLVAGAAGCSSTSGHSPSAGQTPAATTSAVDASTTGQSSTIPSMAPAGTALGSGERVWVAFADRTLSQPAWWAQLKPLLSASARAVYVYDDPRNLPSMTLIGKPHLAAKPPAQPRFTAEVVVPTSKGVFALDLERHTLKSTWLLYAIKFPRTVH